MKLIIRSNSENVEVIALTDDGLEIDTLTMSVGLEIEWTVHDDASETAVCVGLDRALGTDERQEMISSECDLFNQAVKTVEREDASNA